MRYYNRAVSRLSEGIMKIKLEAVSIISSKGRRKCAAGGGNACALGFTLALNSETVIGGRVAAGVKARLIRVEFDFSIECRGEISLLKNGFQSWSHTASFGRDSRQKRQLTRFARSLQENPGNAPTGRRGVASAEMFVLLHDSKGDDLLIAQEIFPEIPPHDSSVPVMEQFVSFRVDLRKKRMTVVLDIDKDFLKGEELSLACVSAVNGEGLTILDSWSRKNARVRDRAVSFFGWCSWYHYYANISVDVIRANLGKASGLHLPIEVFQIDDGYQSAVGDWLTEKESFAGQMPLLSAEIRASGYQPGIWVAPFVAAKKAKISAKADWFVRDDFGRRVWAGYIPGWGGEFFALDTTHPEVIAYIKDCITTIVRGWKFSYLKLDFLYAAALPGVRHDRSRTRAQIYKDAVTLVREAAGDEVYFLGCGAPLSASAGLFEGMRIGCDVAPRWKEAFPDYLLNSDSNVETRGAIRDSLYRAFMKDCFFMVDPDCLLIRATDNDLTQTEQQTLANAMALCGGLFFLSDDLSAYGAREMKILEPVLDIWSECRQGKLWVINWDSVGVPLVCMNTAGYLGIFNLSDEEHHCTVPDTICTPDGKIFDVKESVARKSLLVRPHGSVVFGKIGELHL